MVSGFPKEGGCRLDSAEPPSPGLRPGGAAFRTVQYQRGRLRFQRCGNRAVEGIVSKKHWGRQQCSARVSPEVVSELAKLDPIVRDFAHARVSRMRVALGAVRSAQGVRRGSG